ncbi:hypothetical protein BT69DRAFT_738845 [Atractiella rhizophila]|nr:hypothetical protein BT69DRAFT_738845 [Atractiella rhizophila]
MQHVPRSVILQLQQLYALSASLRSVSSPSPPSYAYRTTLTLISQCLKRIPPSRNATYQGVLRGLILRLHQPTPASGVEEVQGKAERKERLLEKEVLQLARDEYLRSNSRCEDADRDILSSFESAVYSPDTSPSDLPPLLPLAHVLLPSLSRPLLTHYLHALTFHTSTAPEKVLHLLLRLPRGHQTAFLLLPIRGRLLGLEIVLSLTRTECEQSAKFETGTKEKLFDLLSHALDWENVKDGEEVILYEKSFKSSTEPKQRAIGFLIEVEREREKARRRRRTVDGIKWIINSVLLGVIMQSYLKPRELRRVATSASNSNSSSSNSGKVMNNAPGQAKEEEPLQLRELAKAVRPELEPPSLLPSQKETAMEEKMDGKERSSLWTWMHIGSRVTKEERRRLSELLTVGVDHLTMGDMVFVTSTLLDWKRHDHNKFNLDIGSLLSKLIRSISSSFASSPITRNGNQRDTENENKDVTLILLGSLLSLPPSSIPSSALAALSDLLNPSSSNEETRDGLTGVLWSALLRNLAVAAIKRSNWGIALMCLNNPTLDAEARAEVFLHLWRVLPLSTGDSNASAEMNGKEMEDGKGGLSKERQAILHLLPLHPLSGPSVPPLLHLLWNEGFVLVVARLALKYPSALSGEGRLVTKLLKHLVRSRRPRIAEKIFRSIDEETRARQHFDALLSTHCVAVADRIWDEMRNSPEFKSRFMPTLESFNARFLHLSRKGDVQGILKARREMWKWGLEPDISSYNRLIHCYSKAGRRHLVTRTLKEMRWSGVEMNATTANCLLSLRRRGNFPTLRQVERHLEKWKGKEGMTDHVTENIYLKAVLASGKVPGQGKQWMEGERENLIAAVKLETKHELEKNDKWWVERIGKARMSILRRAQKGG